MSCDWLEPGFLWCLFFCCRMQFKHTLGLQDFMNRTENQEQSRAKKRGRGKRGNEIVVRERTGDGREKRGEREEMTIKEERPRRNKERTALNEGTRPLNECQTGFITCKDKCCARVCVSTSVSIGISTLTSPWKLLSKGATCFRKS